MTDNELPIPGAPSDAQIEAEIIRTGGVLFWPTHDSPRRSTPIDLSGLTPETANKAILGRIAAGPGTHSNAYQRAVHDHQRRIAELERERDKLTDQMLEVKRFDPQTGEPIYAYDGHAQTQVAEELNAVARQLALLKGEGGQALLRKGLEKAVADEKARIRREYIEREAARRAAHMGLEAEIEERARGIRKAQGPRL